MGFLFDKKERGKREEKFSFLLKKNEQASKQPFSRFQFFSLSWGRKSISKNSTFSKKEEEKK
jgi:hypothetical protein